VSSRRLLVSRSWEAVTIATLVAVSMWAGDAHAQTDDPADAARFRVGPLALSPSIRLTNIGVDTNVFRENKLDGPDRDVMATASPSTSAWFRFGRVRASSYSQFDFIYFNRLAHLRAVDSENVGRVQVTVNRVTPYLQGNRIVTRHRRNLEIDAPIQRSDVGWTGGVDVRLTSKGSIALHVQRHEYEYSGDTLYLGSDLKVLLNRTVDTEGMGFRYELTPFTAVGIAVGRERNRFRFTPDRDADSIRVRPSVEFKPFALVTGRAEVGIRRRRFANSHIPDMTGVVANLNLGYTLLGTTQLSVSAERDLAYSYHFDLEEYVLSGISIAAVHRLSDSWDVGANIGRYRLSYQQGAPVITPVITDATNMLANTVASTPVTTAAPWETVRSYGAGMGYRLSNNTRLGLQMEYSRRGVDPSLGAWRGYDGLRFTSSLTYDF
jgi:hypothetical protein